MDHTGWVLLAQALTNAQLYTEALLALNTCPIATIPEAEAIKTPGSVKLWIPRRPDAPIDAVGTIKAVAPEGVLERLKASTLRGAPAQIYAVLVEMVGAVGWDGLLKLRSKVFLMEEEYRSSRTAVLSPKGELQTSDPSSPGGIERDGEMRDVPLDDDPHASSPSTDSAGKEKVVAVGEKRLCERWLDHLFMILFEDMRIFTIYQSELAHFETTSTPYQRTPREWLILGSLCRRLGHLDHAKDAYRKCVEAAFCREAWMALLDIYTGEGRLSHALTAALKVIQYEEAHFATASFPSDLGQGILRLIRQHGAERIKSTLTSLKMDGVADGMMQKYLDYAAIHKTIGHDF